MWKILQEFGYDLWLNKASSNVYEEEKIPDGITFKALNQIMQWVSLDLCHETRTVMNYPANNLRISISSNKLDESSDEAPFNYIDD